MRSLLERQGFGAAEPRFEQLESPRLSVGFPEIDVLLGGGVSRGEILECSGGPSSGCTTLALSVLAQVTGQGEQAAYIDASDSLDPYQAEQAGVQLDHLLWVRCGVQKRSFDWRKRRSARSAQAWKATQLAAAAGGFSLIVLDLIGLSLAQLRDLQRFPWFGLRQTIAKSSTTILTLSAEPVTGSVASQSLSLEREQISWRGSVGPALRLTGLSARARLLHQRRNRFGQEVSCRLEAQR
ncbi:MAG: hypothetical protein O3A53_08305 [Acidobacteria bacterium]|nr:hypothetical protein [Acidobacteriota bacterium]MDA1234789.1 hypothetical protein [Acidobacteriota bacterium]